MPFESKKQRKWVHANKPKLAEKWEKKSENIESWWTTLKEGGTITSGKAGITNVTYGKSAKKPKRLKVPKKPKKKKEKGHLIVPEEEDFWRD